MIRRLQLTVLADDCVAAPDLLGEHGLSMLIEADDRRVLFDTGQGRVLCANLSALGISLTGLDAVVLSHGHYDHTGGLPAALAEGCSPAAVFLHPGALAPKYAARESPPYRMIGMPASSREAVERVRERIVWSRSATEVVPGIWCTGEIPRNRKDEGPQSFFLDDQGGEADPLLDDQALFAETARGLVVITGCAHAGVVNTLEYVCKLAGRNEIFALAGGLHLVRSADRQLEETAHALGRLKLRVLAPSHCTGMHAHAHLRTRFQPLVRDLGAGSRLVFEEP